MFKCCVCNSTSKKVDDEADLKPDDETESKLVDAPDDDGSSKLIALPVTAVEPTRDTMRADKPDDGVVRLDKPKDEEAQTANKPENVAQRADRSEDETQRADIPENEIEIADKPGYETQVEDKPDDEMVRLYKPKDDEVQTANKPEDVAQRADKPDGETQGTDKPDDETQGTDKPDDEIQGADKLDDDDDALTESKPEDVAQRADKPDDETQGTDKPKDEIQRVDKLDDDAQEATAGKKPRIVSPTPVPDAEYAISSHEQDERSDFEESSFSSVSTVQEVAEEADKTTGGQDEGSNLESAVSAGPESAIVPRDKHFDSTIRHLLNVCQRKRVRTDIFNRPHDDDDIDSISENVRQLPRRTSEEDDGERASERCSGVQEPPVTPVARDELALRRHRFFSELLQVAQDSTGHRVRFDPLGPRVHTGCGEIRDREEYLEQLVHRLENVTDRLEKVPVLSAFQTEDTAIQTSSASSPRQLTTPRGDSSESDLTSIPFSLPVPIPDKFTNMSVTGYEHLLTGPVKEYLQLSQKIGGDVAAHSKLVEKAFQIQLQFVQTAANRPAPANQTEQLSLLGPMSAQIQQIQDFREKNRGSSFFNHLSAISESIPALGWVAVSPTPAPYVKEMNDAGQFYTNRVLKDWKEKNKIHIDWCKAWVQTLTDLQQYVRQHHTTGLVWGKAGAAPVGIPPPPPPSMPIGDVAAPPMVNDDRSALFAQINQGEDITKSSHNLLTSLTDLTVDLKKVTSEMQTHKNPSLRSGPAPFKAPVVANAMKSVLPANAPIDKPPVFTRDGKKWLVEYHKGENLVIDNVEMNNVVYMFRCQDSTLTVKGKINSVVMDSCRKSSVVFDSLVSSIEFVNCQSVQMQVLGKVPTISIDKTDGCQMYLNAESLNVELITSKSSEMNVMVPKANGDYTEYPVPEQFKTTISQNGLSTMAVDSLG